MTPPPGADAAALAAALADPPLTLVPLAEAHRAALRAACAADPAIWQIYPISLIGDAFDPNFTLLLEQPARFAVLADGAPVGTTAFLNCDAANRTVEIGGTYLAPHARGTGLNRAMKRLMIDRAGACGFTRIEFRIDTRNARSLAAVARLGAVHEGTLRRNRVTWTGYVRDTAIFALVAEEGA